MAVTKSQQMALSSIVNWSLLCGLFVTAFAGLAAFVVQRQNEFAFRGVSVTQLIVCGAGLFVLGTLGPMIFLIWVNWAEKEGPAKIADEIERKLKG